MSQLFAFGDSSPVYAHLWDAGYLSLADAARLGQTCRAGHAWYKTVSKKLFHAAETLNLNIRLFFYFSPFDVDVVGILQTAMQSRMFPVRLRFMQDEFIAHDMNRLMFAIACRSALPRRTELMFAYTEMFNLLSEGSSPYRQAMPSHMGISVQLLAYAMLYKRPGIRWAYTRMAMFRIICAYYFRASPGPAFMLAAEIDIVERKLAFPPIHALRLASLRCCPDEFTGRNDATAVVEWLRTSGRLY